MPSPCCLATIADRIKRLSAAGCACCTLMVTPFALAQSYPVRPVTIVVGFAVGGGADVVARIFAEGLSPILGAPVIVDNRPGAGGTLGGEYVARAVPDGYTLLVGGLGPNATAHSLYPAIKYDTLKDFAHITLISENANALALHPSVPAKTIGELVALARQRPGALSFGSAGNGSAQHMAGELFKRQTRTGILHVPYKGVAAGLNDLLAGRIEMMFIPASDAARFWQSGQLRVLGVTTLSASPALPGIRPIAEAGLPQYEQTVWNALLAPAGTPQRVLETLYTATLKALASAALRTRLEGLGYTTRTTPPGELTAYLRSEIGKYRVLIQDARIQLD
jgi:tripartite-type tricarboxylate transporter receptor subunit TctC